MQARARIRTGKGQDKEGATNEMILCLPYYATFQIHQWFLQLYQDPNLEHPKQWKNVEFKRNTKDERHGPILQIPMDRGYQHRPSMVQQKLGKELDTKEHERIPQESAIEWFQKEPHPQTTSLGPLKTHRVNILGTPWGVPRPWRHAW